MRPVINIAENASHYSQQDPIAIEPSRTSRAKESDRNRDEEPTGRYVRDTRLGTDRGRHCELTGVTIAALFITALHGTSGLLTDFFNKEREPGTWGTAY